MFILIVTRSTYNEVCHLFCQCYLLRVSSRLSSPASLLIRSSWSSYTIHIIGVYLCFFFSFNEFSLQVGPNSFIEFHMESFYPVFFCSVYSFLPFSKGRVMQYSPVLFIMYFAITEMVLFSTKILSEKCTFQFFSISQN